MRRTTVYPLTLAKSHVKRHRHAVMNMNGQPDPNLMAKLRSIPQFVAFCEREWAENADLWAREAQSGLGVMHAAAVAIREIGGGSE